VTDMGTGSAGRGTCQPDRVAIQKGREARDISGGKKDPNKSCISLTKRGERELKTLLRDVGGTKVTKSFARTYFSAQEEKVLVKGTGRCKSNRCRKDPCGKREGPRRVIVAYGTGPS